MEKHTKEAHALINKGLEIVDYFIQFEGDKIEAAKKIALLAAQTAAGNLCKANGIKTRYFEDVIKDINAVKTKEDLFF